MAFELGAPRIWASVRVLLGGPHGLRLGGVGRYHSGRRNGLIFIFIFIFIFFIIECITRAVGHWRRSQAAAVAVQSSADRQ
jgi:hypothetical protein